MKKSFWKQLFDRFKSEIVEYPWIQHIHTLIKMCGEVRGVLIQPSSDYATTVTYHSNLKPYHILSYVIRMFNQLRGQSSIKMMQSL